MIRLRKGQWVMGIEIDCWLFGRMEKCAVLGHKILPSIMTLLKQWEVSPDFSTIWIRVRDTGRHISAYHGPGVADAADVASCSARS